MKAFTFGARINKKRQTVRQAISQPGMETVRLDLNEWLHNLDVQRLSEKRRNF